MSRYVTATLIKRATEDGMVELKDDVPIGKTYEVDLDTISTYVIYNTVRAEHHMKEVIWTRDGGWFATEMLDIPKEQT